MQTVRQPARPLIAADPLTPEFKTAADLRSHYSSLKKRLHGDRSYPIVDMRQMPLLAPEIEVPEPEPEPEPPRPLMPDKRKVYITPTDAFPLTLTRIDILRAVSKVFQISVTELQSPRRWKPAIKARFVYYVLARKYTQSSFPQIGQTVGNRDHSTVMHGITKAGTLFTQMFPLYQAVCDELGLPPPVQSDFYPGAV